MRINHNIPAMVTQGSLFKVNRDTAKSLERLSTGLRINRASDDAAGLGVSENLRTQVRGTAQASRNAQDGIAAINVAEGAANEISDILQRMRELAVQSANDTLTSGERQYTNQEYRQLIDEIDRIAAVTNYNGMKLISSAGTSANDRFGIGGVAGPGSALWIDANAVYGSDSITITIDSLTSNMLGAGAQSGGVANLTVTSLTSQSDSVVAIQQLDESIDSVNRLRSDLGAIVNRLEHGINNLLISNTNQAAAESLIRDVDFAFETTQFTRNQILMQSGTAMLAQANMIPQTVLSLLGG
ncbi:MAG: flagellin [Chitinispirillaceae bacterium]|nr:flagellin [Chitinispirillaceae bacterium]